MSSEIITQIDTNLSTDYSKTINSLSKEIKSIKKITYDKSKYHRKSARVSSKIKPESALFTLIKLIVEHRDQIDIVESVFTINSEDLDLIQKLNYCMEFLARIPFSFQHNKLQSKIILKFFHLEDEMNLINNLEYNNH